MNNPLVSQKKLFKKRTPTPRVNSENDEIEKLVSETTSFSLTESPNFPVQSPIRRKKMRDKLKERLHYNKEQPRLASKRTVSHKAPRLKLCPEFFTEVNFTLVDIRPPNNFKENHFRTAINLPATLFPLPSIETFRVISISEGNYDYELTKEQLQSIGDLLHSSWIGISSHHSKSFNKSPHTIILYDDLSPGRSKSLDRVYYVLSKYLSESDPDNDHLHFAALHKGYEELKEEYGKYVISTYEFRQSMECKAMDSVEDEVISEVLPYFFLSGLMAATDPDQLTKYKITVVINLMEREISYPIPVKVCHFPMLDSLGEDLMASADEIFDIIDEAKRKFKHVLIHCARGQSRSPALVIAYLMFSRKWSLLSSYLFVRNLRSWIGLNPSFMSQLSMWDHFHHRHLLSSSHSSPFPLSSYMAFENRSESFLDNIEFFNMKDPEEGMVIKYIEYNKIAEVCALLTKNPHLRYSRRKYDDASTLLVWILSSHKLGNKESKQLLDMLVGDDEEMVNMDTLDGSTPLHIATGYCDLPLVEYLIKEKGAVVGKRDNEGRNELHIAARSSSSERFDLTFDLINFIISHSPKCSPLIVPDKYNMTPIDYANIANKDRNLFILLRNRSITELLHSATSTCLSLSLSSLLEILFEITESNVCSSLYRDHFADAVRLINQNQSSDELLSSYSLLFPSSSMDDVKDCIYSYHDANNANSLPVITLSSDENGITKITYRETISRTFSPNFDIPKFMAILRNNVAKSRSHLEKRFCDIACTWVDEINSIHVIREMLDVIAQSIVEIMSQICISESGDYEALRNSFSEIENLM